MEDDDKRGFSPHVSSSSSMLARSFRRVACIARSLRAAHGVDTVTQHTPAHDVVFIVT